MPITISEEFIRSLATSRQDVLEAETLPPECYTDANFYEFEKDALFTHDWLCVGREEWVKEPGDYFTTSTVNEPIVVARNRKGEIKAMSSVCQHRAMLVAEGSGNARGFVCPYHHWSYSLDGDLVGAPAMNKTCEFDRKAHGLPIIYPKTSLKYTANFLHMMFSLPGEDIELKPEIVRALDLIFLLHADHEQNCSTSTVRMVASSRANLFASASAGVCALWGPLHGGANQAVLEMLEQLHQEGDDGSKFLKQVKDKTTDRRLMGFGHRVYKNFDPRAVIIKQQCDKVLAQLHKSDPLLDIAKKLEEIALHDDYFVSRKLYPNVDFYSGIIMRAIGIPLDMFTVMFAIGRMPGWIANFKEVMEDPDSRIARPRQIYTGPTLRNYVPMEERA